MKREASQHDRKVKRHPLCSGRGVTPSQSHRRQRTRQHTTNSNNRKSKTDQLTTETSADCTSQCIRARGDNLDRSIRRGLFFLPIILSPCSAHSALEIQNSGLSFIISANTEPPKNTICLRRGGSSILNLNLAKT